MKIRPIYSAARLSLPFATALVAVISHFATPSASAAALTWSGGNGNWTDGAAGGWSGTWMNGSDTGTFTGAGGTVTLTTAITVADLPAGSLAFGAAGDYTLSAASPRTLTLNTATSGATSTPATRAIAVAAGRTTTVGANVTIATIAANRNQVISGADLTSKWVIENGGTIRGNGTTSSNILSLNDITVEVKTGGILTATAASGSGTALFVNGDLNVQGGTVTAIGTLGLGQATGTLAGNLTLTSGSITASSANGIRFGTTAATAGGTIHLDGGTLSALMIQKGAGALTSVLNLNGGLLRATATAPTFVAGLDRANVRTGGARIDSNGFDLTVAQALLNSNFNSETITDGGLTKSGLGTLTLTGANTYNGATSVNQGTLILGSGAIGSLNSSSALQMGGGTFTYSRTGADQAVNGLTVNAGGSTINNTVSGQNLTLGTITRTGSNARGMIHFGTNTGGIISSVANVNGIVGPWASFGTGVDTRYAVANGASAITGLTGTPAATAADVTDTAGTFNYDVAAAGTLGTSASINTLRYTGAAGALATTTSFTTLGIMNSGTGLLTFSGAVRSAASGKTTEMVVNTANSDITFGGILTGTITKTGSGTMTLGGVANSIGGITVNQGILITNNSTNDQLPSATINSGGTLRWGASNKIANSSVITVNAGGTLDVNGQSDTIGGLTGSGTVTNAAGVGLLTLQGSGHTFSGSFTNLTTVQVNNGADYTFTGLSNNSRGFSINGGSTLRINSVANTSTPSAIGGGAGGTVTNATITIGGTSGNGTLVYTGTGHSTNRPYQIGTNSSTPAVTDTGGAIIQADGASNAAVTFSGYTSSFFNVQTNATTGVGADRTLTLQGASTGNNTISGIIRDNLATTGTARVGVTKAQAGTWVLSGLNTYTGDTTVSGGTLTLGQINASNEASTVSIASGAVLNLTFAGTDTVANLFLNGVQQPIGVYGSGNSGGLITGTGTLTVSPAPVGGFSSWITGFGLALADQDPTDDPENDGMNNLLEFVLNGNPSLSDTSILPTLVVTATDFEFTYQRRDDSVSPQTTQTFQWGTTLATWPGSAVIPAASATVGVATITVSPGIPNDAVTDTVKISIPKTEAGASDKLFGRLQVVK